MCLITVLSLVITPTARAQANADVSCEPLGSAQSIEISAPAALSSDCGAYLDDAGQEAQFCQWRFDYRSDTALAAFSAAETALDGCFNKAVPDHAQVNHPDSYQQVFYTTPDHQISVALKDKGQLNATFLFLRIESAP